MNLLKNKEAFMELVETVATTNGLLETIVEKDYMVSVLLEQLSSIDSLQIVFKGGTSLSKCYSVIHRFSEDIDIAIQMRPEEIKDRTKRDLKYEVQRAIEKVGFKLINPESIMSRMDFNQYLVAYPKRYKDAASVNPNIIVETIVAYEPYPCVEREVTNFILDFLEETENHDIIEKYDLKRFKMTVQSIERTFIDKLYALCDCYLARRYARISRHLYDVHMIWQSGCINFAILNDLAVSVAKDRQLVGRGNLSCRPGTRTNEILLNIVSEEVYKQDFLAITSNLIFDKISYDDCSQTLMTISKKAILPVEIKQY